jgi:GAF domain-containing protein
MLDETRLAQIETAGAAWLTEQQLADLTRALRVAWQERDAAEHAVIAAVATLDECARDLFEVRAERDRLRVALQQCIDWEDLSAGAYEDRYGDVEAVVVARAALTPPDPPDMSR